MAELHDTHTGALVVHDLALGLKEDLSGHTPRATAKVEKFPSVLLSLLARK